jgi:hypothetical protein
MASSLSSKHADPLAVGVERAGSSLVPQNERWEGGIGPQKYCGEKKTLLTLTTITTKPFSRLEMKPHETKKGIK